MTGYQALVCLLVTAASAIHQDSFNGGKVAHSKDDAYYNFRYAVDDHQSGVVSDRWETRSGRFVKGAYSLLGPDGKVRSVHYEVDGDHGFKAVVRTDPPRLNLLSIQSDREVRLTHADPPANTELVQPPLTASLEPPSELPYNYHARPEPNRPRSAPSPQPQPLPSPSSTLLAFAPVGLRTPASHDSSLFSNDLLHRPNFDDEDLQALQDLTPPAVDAFSRTYDSYPRPVRTNPNRRHEAPVQDGHRTVYSDYVSKQLKRTNPSRSARLVRLPAENRVPIPAPEATLPKRNDQLSLQPAPFSRYWNRPRQFFRETSPQSASYFD